MEEQRGDGMQANGMDVRTAGGCFMQLGKRLAQQRHVAKKASRGTAGVVDFQLRSYQQELLEESRDVNALLVAPTGTGKTIIAAEVIMHKLLEGHNCPQLVVCVQKTQVAQSCTQSH